MKWHSHGSDNAACQDRFSYRAACGFANVVSGPSALYAPSLHRRYLNTTDKRQAKELEKDRIAEIKQGKGASKTGREFARKPFSEAAEIYLTERKPHVSERTMQFEKERLKPLCKHFGESALLRFKAQDVAAYQSARLEAGVSGRTVNMETGVLGRMLKRAKVWNAISEDVRALPERHRMVGKALPADLKHKLFEVAASREEWMVAHCAAVLAVSTTCRGVTSQTLPSNRPSVCIPLISVVGATGLEPVTSCV
jgi:hypothetical protein